MRYTAGHSTSCCGAHSFSGFGPEENRNPNIINQTMQQGPVGRLADITLNRGQITRNPAMMQRLADLGFVLDAHWVNSVHRSDVYRFTRCDTRRPLLAGIEGHWNGMVMNAGLTGDLPAVPNIQGGAGGQARVRRLRFRPGDRVRVTSRATRRFGREFTIEDCPNNGFDQIARMRDDRENNVMFRLSFDSLELVQAAEDRAPPPLPPAPQRHENAEFAVAANAPVAPAVPPRGAVIGIGSRVRRSPNEIIPNGIPAGSVGTVTRPARGVGGAGGWYVRWDHTGNDHIWTFARNLELIEEPVAPPAPPPAPAAQPVRIVGRYWHCVFRDGRRGAGYQSFAEANRNLGRRTRIDRFEIQSNGETRWVERVNN